MPARMPTTIRTTRPTVLLFRAARSSVRLHDLVRFSLRRLEALLDSALIEPERRVLVAHQEHVGRDPRDPAVEPEHEVEDPLG